MIRVPRIYLEQASPPRSNGRAVRSPKGARNMYQELESRLKYASVWRLPRLLVWDSHSAYFAQRNDRWYRKEQGIMQTYRILLIKVSSKVRLGDAHVLTELPLPIEWAWCNQTFDDGIGSKGQRPTDSCDDSTFHWFESLCEWVGCRGGLCVGAVKGKQSSRATIRLGKKAKASVNTCDPDQDPRPDHQRAG